MGLGDVGQLDSSFVQRRRCGFVHQKTKNSSSTRLSRPVPRRRFDRIPDQSSLSSHDFAAERGQIGTDVTMRLDCNLFQVNVIVQLHVLLVNAQNFQVVSCVRNANVVFTIETAEAGSIELGRLVAPKIITWALFFMPSIRVSSFETKRSSISS